MSVTAWGILSNWDTWGVVLAFSAVNLALLVARTPWGRGVGTRLRSAAARLSGCPDLRWIDWRFLVVFGALWIGAFVGNELRIGQFDCAAGSINDPMGLLSSGRAFFAGADPADAVSYCGFTTIQVPYGIAAIGIDAVGSLGGLVGICAIWAAVALLLIPLVWKAGGADRQYLTLFVATSVLYLPLVTGQIGDANNVLVPITLVAVLLVAGTRRVAGSALGGLLATAKFPAMVPLLGHAGRSDPHRLRAVLASAGVFVGGTAVGYAAWGWGFLRAVFLAELGRRSFSLNLYGVLLVQNRLPSAAWVEAIEAAVTLGIVLSVALWIRSPIRAMAIGIVGVALVTPFLSYNILIWLLPVALAGPRARWALWGAGAIGTLNYGYALNGLAWVGGPVWPTELLDVAMTAVLGALFVDLWRSERSEGGRDLARGDVRRPDRPPAAAPDATSTSGRVLAPAGSQNR